MKTLTLILLLLTLSCTSKSETENPREKQSKEHRKRNNTYHDGNVYISQVGQCKYVFWHYGNGSDMEHYEGCTNLQHCK